MASRPYMSVRVSFANSDYENVCLDYGGGRACLAAWRDLGDLLANRAGWHFDVNTASHDKVLWNAGLFGESRLNIHVDANGRFACFDYDADNAGEADPVTTCATIAEVEGWIAARADRAARPSATAVAYAGDSDWAGLKAHAHQVRITWSGNSYHASLPEIYEASVGTTLQDALDGVASLLCRLLGAPAELARQVPLTAELDQAAVEQLRKPGI
jgi:hypothetical protein